MTADLFNSIAQSYDRFNHLLSLGIDITWRKRAIRKLRNLSTSKILDLACGTGDFAIEMVRRGANDITGCDISDGMLNIGRQKVDKKHLNDKIKLINADCLQLPFDDNSFNIVTCSYGVRNFAHRAECLREMKRVLKPDGQLLVLEFAMPRVFPVKQLYNFYFRHIMPRVGSTLSGDKAPYIYFYNSVKNFPQRNTFMDELKDAGFVPTEYHTMTFGISIAYYATKQ